MLSLFVNAALMGKAPTIHGDGEQTRDLIFIDSVVQGVLRATNAPEAADEVINVAGDQRVSLNGAWAALQKILGPLPAPSYGPNRVGDVRDSQADIGKAERLLGYRPTVPFEEGLLRTVDWQSGGCGPGGPGGASGAGGLFS